MKVGHSVGLSARDMGGGKWQLRWRQHEEQPDGSRKRVERTVLAYSHEERKRLEIDIERALSTKGYWTAALPGAKPLDLNLEKVAAAWIEFKVVLRKARPNTRVALAGCMSRFFKGLRAVLGLKATDVVPGSAMTIPNVTAVQTRWAQDRAFAEATIYQTIAAAVDMWKWAADQPSYPIEVLPRPPYNRDNVMPKTVLYAAPEAVATMAELDACLRRIRLPMPRRVATIMRYTGLRIEQAAMIHREDVDLAGATLLIRKGKTRREQALMRRVPVAPGLIADLGCWLATLPEGPIFPDLKARDDAGNPLPMVSYRNLTRYVTEAWEAATQAGEARRETWQPPSRLKARPDHVFRGAFMAALQEAGIGDAVIDHLVGHAAKTTRAQAYTAPSSSALKRAVEVIPAVDWGDQEEGANVVFLSRKCRA